MIWQKTCERYVAFFDLPGFKDKAASETHADILKKMQILKDAAENPESVDWVDSQKMKLNIDSDQTKSLTLSDSIILFSKGSSVADFFKIITDSCAIRKSAIKNNIPVRIVISYGTVTIDFDNALFLGQPIIDACELLEDLFYLSIVLDNSAEKKVNSYKENKIIKDLLMFRKAQWEYGSISHTIISATKKEVIDEDISILKKLYNVTSAVQKLYIDNTLDFYIN